jgi:hypothetical protein
MLQPDVFPFDLAEIFEPLQQCPKIWLLLFGAAAVPSTPTVGILSTCCLRAVSGHMAAAPPIAEMKSRRPMGGGKLRGVIVAGVNALPVDTKARVLLAVQSFSNFTKDNDPYGEHDFGSFQIEGETYFWKIEYYDLAMQFGSPDAADPEQTTRVLTIMRADEY